MVKFVDAFLFYNELDLLEYRLSILYDIVDYFVIVEATKTFVGNKKPLYYAENKARFEKFSDKIIHVIDDELQENISPWINETHQRNSIHKGIEQLNLNEDDKIMISDVDEIPDIDKLKELISDTSITFVTLEQDFYYYNLTCKIDRKWDKVKLINYNYYIQMKTPELIRSRQLMKKIYPCGWHLSYFGNTAYIKNKLQNFSHQEFNNDNYTNEDIIKKRVDNCLDLYGRGDYTLIKIPVNVNNYLPPQYNIYLQEFM